MNISVFDYSQRERNERNRGASLVEFLIFLPVFVTIFLAVNDLGNALVQHSRITSVAEEAMRQASRLNGLEAATEEASVYASQVNLVSGTSSYITEGHPDFHYTDGSTHQVVHRRIAHLLLFESLDKPLALDNILVDTEYRDTGGTPTEDAVRLKISGKYQSRFPRISGTLFWFFGLDGMNIESEVYGPYLR